MNTLFYNLKSIIDSFKFQYSLLVSEEFITCADKQLTEIFITKTGINPGKNACISLTEHYIGAPVYTTYLLNDGTNTIGRKLLIRLFINHNWNPISILWKSKSGNDYKLHSTDIDSTDIEFWFEHLDTLLYLKQLYPNSELPFELKDLSYKLTVTRLNMDCDLLLKVKSGFNKENIINELSDFIEKFNKSSRANTKYGVVHNFKNKIENETNILFEMDLGSAGVFFLKKILKKMSDLSAFDSIEIL